MRIHLQAFLDGRSCRLWAAVVRRATTRASERQSRPIDPESRAPPCTPTLTTKKDPLNQNDVVAGEAKRLTLCCVTLGAGDATKATVKVAARGEVGHGSRAIESVEGAEEG